MRFLVAAPFAVVLGPLVGVGVEELGLMEDPFVVRVPLF
jgi:hypothetical protein